MKFKLDENLGRRCLEILTADGHDVATVAGQRMNAVEDRVLIDVCRSEGRALVTLDLDFSNPLVFPPQSYKGIAVLRPRGRASREELILLVRTLADAVRREALEGQLWSVELGRVRIYQPPV